MARRRFQPKPAKVVPGAAEAAAARAAVAASRVATINLEAAIGRTDVVQGSRVRIASGLYAGEIATVESVIGGVIPAAVVRTDAGSTRRVRAIDLVLAPVVGAPEAAADDEPPPGRPASSS